MNVTIEFKRWLWLFLALVAHSGWGCFPGITRYLQVEANLGGLLVISGALVATTVVVGIPLVFIHGFLGLFRMNKLWLYVIISIVLDVPFVYASRFTLSVNVQLIFLSSPFMVVLLSKLLLSAPVPPWTWTAIFFSTIGAFLALFGELKLDTISTDDIIGYFLSLLAAFGLAAYIVFVSNVEQTVSSFVVMWLYVACAGAILLPISYFIEDWSIVTELQILAWVLWICFALGLFILSNLLLIMSIRVLGAQIVGTILPWRLVIALIFGAVVLDENLGVLNLIGSAVVVITLLAYLYYQYWSTQQLEEDKQPLVVGEHDTAVNKEPLVDPVEG